MRNLFKISLFFSSLVVISANSALATPLNPSAAAGEITVNRDGKYTDIFQHNERVIIDWSSFNVSAHEQVNFVQPNSNSIALNRIHDIEPSRIDGTINANGKIVLINPNGIFFGANSKVDVAGITAATSHVETNAFMNYGRLESVDAGNPNASIINNGTITTENGGEVNLIAPNVTNNGTINAKGGKISVGGADMFVADLYGDGLIYVDVTPQATQTNITNTGKIVARGGKVTIVSDSSSQAGISNIKNSGTISANSTIGKKGSVVISNTNSVSKTFIGGTIDVSGVDYDSDGGTIDLMSGLLTVSYATLNADGRNGGLIKLNAIGKPLNVNGVLYTPTTSTAKNLDVIYFSSLHANGTYGNGGTISAFSEGKIYLGLFSSMQASGSSWFTTNGGNILLRSNIVDGGYNAGTSFATWFGANAKVVENNFYVPKVTHNYHYVVDTKDDYYISDTYYEDDYYRSDR